MQIKVMPESFEPRRRGNRPTFNIAPMLEALEEEQSGRWLGFTMTKTQARSAKRQLDKYDGLDLSVEIDPDGEHAVVYARRLP